MSSMYAGGESSVLIYPGALQGLGQECGTDIHADGICIWYPAGYWLEKEKVPGYEP